MRLRRSGRKFPLSLLADDLELSNDALHSVDALVDKSDGSDFLLATLHFVLKVKPWPSAYPSKPKRTRHMSGMSLDLPFSATVWESILNGTIHF